MEERRLSANPTNDDGRGTQTQLVRALPRVCDLVDEEPDGPTQYDVQVALTLSKRGKAPGLSGVTTDLLKTFSDLLVGPLLELFQVHWDNPDSVPQRYKDAKVISLFKKGDRKDPSNYRGIFLLDSIGKLFCRIVYRRLLDFYGTRMDPYQFGFRKQRSTAQAVWTLRNLIQRARDLKKCMYLVFIDLVKAFDTVDRPLLFKTLADLGLAPVVRNLVEAIHTTPYGEITSKSRFAVERGVRQGCVVGPFLFNIAMDYLCRKSLNCADRGSCLIDHLAYADDLVLIAYDENTMHLKLQNLNNEIRKFGMEISVKKIKCLIVGGNTNKPQSDFKLPDGPIEQVHSFNYLGCIIDTDNDQASLIRNNCMKARIGLVKLRAALVNGSLSFKVKASLVEVFIKPILLYGLETGVTRESDLSKLNAVLNKARRMILRVQDKREIRCAHLAELIQLRDIRIELGIRRLNLWYSLKSLGTESVLGTVNDSKVWQRCWMKQLERDVLSFGLTSDWIDAPFRVGFRCQKIVCDVPLVGTRTHTLECPFEGCNLTFAEAKEQNRHTLTDHTSLSAQSVQFDLQKATSFGCPMTNCSKSFKTKGWLKSHLHKNHKSGCFLGNTFVYTSENGEASVNEVPDDPHTGPSASSPPQASNFNGNKRRRALRSNPTGPVEMRNTQVANRGGLTTTDPRCSEILNNTDNITLSSSDTYAQGLIAASKGPDIAMTGRPPGGVVKLPK